MIERIQIENFQSHKKTDISFSKGINVIVGRGDSGKSAIFRAFRKVLRNQPDGTGHVNDDANFCSIKINDDVERVIKVKRKESGDTETVDNYLQIGEGNEGKFSKLGKGLPPVELFDHLQISPPIEISNFDEDFNFILQDDPPFLIHRKTYSPGLAVKFLDYLSGVGILNKCMQIIKNRELKNNQAIKQYEIDCNELEGQLKGFDYVSLLEEYCDKLNQIEEKQIKLNKLIVLSESLSKLNSNLSVLKNQQNILNSIKEKDIGYTYHNCKKRLEKLLILERCNNDLKDLDTLPKTFEETLISLSTEYDRLLSLLINMREFESITNDIEAIPNIKSVNELKVKFFKLSCIMKLVNVDEDLQVSEEMNNILLNDIELADKKKSQTLKALKICPTCNGKIV